MMKYEKLINAIFKEIGGEENVQSLSHCMTRLRFVLKDDSKIDIEKAKKIPGIIDCLIKGGQFQVVIGTYVEEVFHEICLIKKIDNKISESNSVKEKNPINRFFDTLAGIFMPIVGALAGAGMVKAFLAVTTAIGWINTDSQTYMIIFMISDAVFYFLPFLLAFSAALKLNCSPYLAALFAGCLLHPTMSELKVLPGGAALFGIPMHIVTYSTSVIPIILIVLFQSYAERFAKKISPKAIRVFFVPMVTIFITAPVGLILLGPIGGIIGTYLASFFNFLNDRVSWMVPTLVGGLFPLLVMTGMHYSLGAVQATQRAAVGYATILAPGALSSNMAQAAATFAVSLRTKDKNLKSLASSSAVTALCGVTEPALYGINIKLKRPLYATMIGGSTAGLYAGITGMKAWSAGTSNIFSIPIYIGGDNSFIHAIITTVIALTVGFTASYLLYKEPEKPNNEIDKKNIIIPSPVTGTVVPLNKISDAAFSSGALGNGIAVEPTVGRITAPFSGKVVALFETNHAIGLMDENGIELIIHIGIDTVKLNGEFFNAYVKKGDKIKEGDILISFDIENIQKAGYSVTTPIVVSSHDACQVIPIDAKDLAIGEPALTISGLSMKNLS